MAETSVYFGEAYEALQRLSADERRRLEYEERDKALKDYNTQMSSALRQGQKIGEEIGEKRCNSSIEKVQMILQNVKSGF